MRTPSARTVRSAAALALAAATLLSTAACGGGEDTPDEVSVEPQPAARSPEVTVSPAGTVSPFAPVDALTFDADTRTLVALTDGSTTVRLIPAAPDGDSVDGDSDDGARVIELGFAGAGLVPGRGSSVLVPTNGSVSRIDVAAATRTDTAVDGVALSAADLPDGNLAVGDENGTVRVLDATGEVVSTVSGSSVTSADALADTDGGLSVLDRNQTSLTDVNLDDETFGVALRAGEGAAALITDSFGRLLVTDSTGTELLVFTSHDLLMRQRFPVGSPPWAIAYDEQSGVVWVTLPAVNQVVGYTLDTGIPVEVQRFATVRQPNSIAVDTGTGELLVGSATGDGLQRIPTAVR